jgi:hypothetical protein
MLRVVGTVLRTYTEYSVRTPYRSEESQAGTTMRWIIRTLEPQTWNMDDGTFPKDHSQAPARWPSYSPPPPTQSVPANAAATCGVFTVPECSQNRTRFLVVIHVLCGTSRSRNTTTTVRSTTLFIPSIGILHKVWISASPAEP